MNVLEAPLHDIAGGSIRESIAISGEHSVQEAIAKANTLIEAIGWIRRFRGTTTVIKLGGSIVENEEALMHILLDVIFMERLE